MHWLGRTFSANATGYVRVRVDESQSELCLWRKESEEMASTINFSMPDVFMTSRLERVWYECAARRFILDWFCSRYLSELPVAANPQGFTLVLVGTAEQLDDRALARLQDIRRYLEVLEQHRTREPTEAKPPSTKAPPLTTREIEVLEMLADGHPARRIARQLGVSERTIHKHLSNLYAKLGVHDRLLAVRNAESLGLIRPTTEGGATGL
jgi:DNA-binding CsgD family transcriptional regulator